MPTFTAAPRAGTPELTARTIRTPLGDMVLAATPRGVCLCEFTDRRALPAERAWLERWASASFSDGHSAHLDLLADELARYFAGDLRVFTVALDTPGTPFQRAVWDQLLLIPLGQTASYGAIAQRLGKPGAQRAVGLANGGNRVSIVVPCHRVIESSGKLRGYGGGLWRKRALLTLENARFVDAARATPNLFAEPEPEIG